jgi:hypothetical protein
MELHKSFSCLLLRAIRMGLRAYLLHLIPVCIVIATLIWSANPAHATLPYSKETGKKCYYCHANQIGEESVLTEQGVYWLTHNKSFEGMPDELVPDPPQPLKVKNTPVVGIIVGNAFFLGILLMIIVGIVKKPAPKPADSAAETETTRTNGSNGAG